MGNNQSGRSLKFKSPEILENKIEEFFKMCDDENKIPTITGLAYFLDVTRKTLLKYEHSDKYGSLKKVNEDIREEYEDIVKRAKAKIEAKYEQLLFDRNTVVGAIFTLKNNFGWVDKHEVEQTNKTIEVALVE